MVWSCPGAGLGSVSVSGPVPEPWWGPGAGPPPWRERPRPPASRRADQDRVFHQL
ncbi:hypothetical protein APASM_3270 [Actinosynnema pretiosum subsp. pretiosum]|nr:hypothetical protein APASM_3270 [Actinosynnema pretiosum subsp. pretiosum]